MTARPFYLCSKSHIRLYVPAINPQRRGKQLIRQARILVSLATQQDKEVGDGTTSVVLLASELLRRANELVRNKIHPTTVITGYR